MQEEGGATGLQMRQRVGNQAGAVGQIGNNALSGPRARPVSGAAS